MALEEEIKAMSPTGVTRKRKKISRKKQLMTLQRRAYDMEGVLAKTRRQVTSLLPWDEVTQALKDDIVEQAMNNRCLQRQVDAQRRMSEVLYAWVQSMSPSERTPSAVEETWRHSYMPKADIDTRSMAQSWIVQQSYYNAGRAMAAASFPDSLETRIEVDVAIDAIEDLFHVTIVSQVVVPYSLEDTTEGYWVADNTFPSLVALDELPAADALRRMAEGDVRYDVNSESPTIRLNSLHGYVREPDRTTFVFRAILVDEAFPTVAGLPAWTVDTKTWTVADRMGASCTRLRTFCTMGHPHMPDVGYMPMATLASILNVPLDDDFRRRQRARLVRAHNAQREQFHVHLLRVLQRLT
ncbi:Aste57867_18456 [Aphanomyces stellatus]|uniref:Aste57867_18456 protein n=1 Tax=Aphanomyces stellatus TaxID=120398 RepID=A0A485LB04_9STRA|nr:hypothetical protein As57867_018394 [Aphanomyces stellatus]VFT95192.1 Aste57867_18456 [Aphanomyces stellatus]